MKYKEFVSWCNERACDGYWGFNEVVICSKIMESVRAEPFYRREKVWQRDFAKDVERDIVIPINAKIRAYEQMMNTLK